jgi:hypothetical protein
MIGPKKLSTIREELRLALAATGEDPIRWLEMRMAASTTKSEVLQYLRDFLKGPTRKKRPKKVISGRKK